ncbi:MAG TPA: T9SS type A sorting domain-containing protein [Lentimicrobium sp.]|nr:T9SS type A sorting domain-containing protein [Lentimicrobium sp.]
MKIFYTIFAYLIAGLLSLQAQIKPPFPAQNDLPPMTSYDSTQLSTLPEFKLPQSVTKRMLPSYVNNSSKPWFRPMFNQAGLECGQASSIGFVFTYEMDFLRNFPASSTDNQYATHFAYNFVNGGTDAGVSFYETYEILKYAGCPTVQSYGGMSAGGPSRWMNGYNLYYQAMQNRVNEVYSIKLNTVEGLQTLKNWLFDHGNGSPDGGISCFYAQYVAPSYRLEEGTPEAGKYVIHTWGSSANHSMTIVGYNDEIRWDYNNDGQYTDDIDINLDGLIDLRDCEIGGFIIANTYGGYYTWGDQGFCYMMYKSVADAYQQGGIWNNTAVIIDVKDIYIPQLTAKVSLTYSCRKNLRVMVGVSSNPNATQPDHIMHYPIFDFQGGCNPMQGTSGPAVIEFGLDLNYLLQYLTPGQEAKFFLMVQEDDVFDVERGSIGSFALIDYTNAANIINSDISELPLVNNGITYATVNAALNFDPVEILTDNLPPIELYSNYSYSLQAISGTPPYKWNIAENYSITDSVSEMQVIDAVKLQPSSNSNGMAKIELPFSFPFYGNSYEAIYATSDGSIMFEDSNIPWPFYIEGRTYFLENAMIAPCMSHPFVIGSTSEGIWYEESEDYVTLRWKLSVTQVTGTVMNATVRLYPSGRIEINYGEFIVPSYTERHAGISAGDGQNYKILTYDPDFTPSVDQLTIFDPMDTHHGISLTKEGVLVGLTDEIQDSIPINACVTDKNNLKCYKILYLNTEGLFIDYDIAAGDDNIIGFGEDVYITIHIKNLNSYSLSETTLNLSTSDAYYTIVDGIETISGLAPGDTLTLPNAFHLITHNNVPDKYQTPFVINAVSNEGNWSRTVPLVAYRAITEITSVKIVDGNNEVLDPGETVLLAIDIINTGGAELTNGVAFITTWNPYLTIYLSSVSRDTLNSGEEWSLIYGIMLSPEAPLNEIVDFNLSITGDHYFSYFKTIPLYTGLILEDFESGDFNSYNWETAGHASWYPLQGSAYEGEWCARSGVITDNEVSTLALEWDVAYPDSLSFYFKVVSEPTYDYLRFFCNQTEVAKWSGNINWSKATIGVAAGHNLFTWKYTKDYSISTGDDCAWLDYIVLPVYSIATPVSDIQKIKATLSVSPNPATDKFEVSYTLEEPTPVKLYLIDMHGRILYIYEMSEAGSLQNRLVIDALNIHAGVYAVVLKTKKGTLVKKVIKTS